MSENKVIFLLFGWSNPLRKAAKTLQKSEVVTAEWVIEYYKWYEWKHDLEVSFLQKTIEDLWEAFTENWTLGGDLKAACDFSALPSSEFHNDSIEKAPACLSVC